MRKESCEYGPTLRIYLRQALTMLQRLHVCSRAMYHPDQSTVHCRTGGRHYLRGGLAFENYGCSERTQRSLKPLAIPATVLHRNFAWLGSRHRLLVPQYATLLHYGRRTFSYNLILYTISFPRFADAAGPSNYRCADLDHNSGFRDILLHDWKVQYIALERCRAHG